MNDRKDDTSAKKPDLRDQPSTSLKNTSVQSPMRDPERLRSGLDVAKPSIGGQATGQTSRQ